MKGMRKGERKKKKGGLHKYSEEALNKEHSRHRKPCEGAA